jgi:hypothetical protein
LQNLPQTRVQTRALTATAVVAALVGASLGGAYMAGAHAQAEPQAQAAPVGALRQVAMSPPAVQPANPLLVRTSLVAALKSDGLRPATPFHAQGAGDVDCLTQAVYYEARGESAAGQAAVAQVVLNRTRHPAFPHSVCGVVFQRAAGACQFSFACDGSMRSRREGSAWARAHAVAEKALAGYVMPDVGSATNFHTTSVNPGWRGTMMQVAQVGAHIFYRLGGRFIAPQNSFGRRPDVAQPETLTARLAPAAPVVDPTLTADGHAPIVMTALTTTPPALKVENGMGGPLGKPIEPASAPKVIEVKAALKPASEPKAAAPSASLKPVTTLASAS